MKFFNVGLLYFLMIGILAAVASGFRAEQQADNPTRRGDVKCRGGGEGGGGGGNYGRMGGRRGRYTTPPTAGDAENIPVASGAGDALAA